MSPMQRNRILAWEGITPMYGGEPNRKQKRRYRKLRRQAKRRGMTVDEVLIERVGNRKWEEIQNHMGKFFKWHEYYRRSNPVYICKALDTRVDRRQKKDGTWKSFREVKIEIQYLYNRGWGHFNRVATLRSEKETLWVAPCSIHTNLLKEGTRDREEALVWYPPQETR